MSFFEGDWHLRRTNQTTAAQCKEDGVRISC